MYYTETKNGISMNNQHEGLIYLSTRLSHTFFFLVAAGASSASFKSIYVVLSEETITSWTVVITYPGS